MKLQKEAKDILIQLANIINQLNFNEYNYKIALLSNATIGEHTRHIIELFQQLLSEYDSGNINYDNRKRHIRLQENSNFTTEIIENIITVIKKENKKLNITTLSNNQQSVIESNFERELLYNIEHCIHHQAIIKIGLLYLKKTDIHENFGVAKSTIKYRKKCLQ